MTTQTFGADRAAHQLRFLQRRWRRRLRLLVVVLGISVCCSVTMLMMKHVAKGVVVVMDDPRVAQIIAMRDQKEQFTHQRKRQWRRRHYSNEVTFQVPPPIDTIHVESRNGIGNSSHPLLLVDALVKKQLPMVYPARFAPCQSKTTKVFETVFAMAEWKHRTGLDASIDTARNATAAAADTLTVLGAWPDTVTSLSYIPILKNAHTSLAKAFGGLAQRLPNATVTVFNKRNPLFMSMRNHSTSSSSSSSSVNFFAILRDPIDRFVSATCQDLRDGSNVPIHQCFSTKLDGRTSTTNNQTSDKQMRMASTIQCLVDKLEVRFTHHQRHQYCQLLDVMTGLDTTPVSVIAFDRLPDLYRELGAANEKVRDRNDAMYLTFKRSGKRGGSSDFASHSSPKSQAKSLDRMAAFCSQAIDFLNHTTVVWRNLRQRICLVYEYDVTMMRSVGIDVPLCNGIL